ncbi:MAG TPA: hypothetical protein PKA06_06955, partial [Gemmatales bacterium]|nr:hypothetical protein [Gemmatales bacterium]
WITLLPVAEAFWYSLGGTLAFGAFLQLCKVNMIGRKYRVLQPRSTKLQTCIQCSETVKTIAPR